eukprot:10919062-Alexandrium_andersonii.AAC.1
MHRLRRAEPGSAELDSAPMRSSLQRRRAFCARTAGGPRRAWRGPPRRLLAGFWQPAFRTTC